MTFTQSLNIYFYSPLQQPGAIQRGLHQEKARIKQSYSKIRKSNIEAEGKGHSATLY